jgi:BASS family bile acid:Na+ symporter
MWRDARKEGCMREAIEYINTIVKRYFVHLFTCTVCVGALWPRASLGLKDLVFFHVPGTSCPVDLLTFALCCMMFAASTHCRLHDFIRLATTPRAFLVGVSLVYLWLPGVGWAGAKVGIALLGPTVGPQIGAGLVLVVLMPIAMTSNVWVKMVEGNLALVVSLISCTAALSIVVTPLSMALLVGLAQNDLHVPTALLMKQLLITVMTPMLAGMLLRELCEAWVQHWQGVFALVGSVGLYLVVFANVGVALPVLKSLDLLAMLSVVGLIIALNLLNDGIAYLLSHWAHLSSADRATICLAGSMRSNGTALVVGLTSFPMAPFVTVPAAINIIVQHLVAGQLVKCLHTERPALAGAMDPSRRTRARLLAPTATHASVAVR